MIHKKIVFQYVAEIAAKKEIKKNKKKETII